MGGALILTYDPLCLPPKMQQRQNHSYFQIPLPP
jgi:hypothetical protein